MGMSSYEAEARALLKQHGKYLRRALHGDLWVVGDTTVQAQTHHPPGQGSGDPRAWKNTLAEIKRALRPAEEPNVTNVTTENKKTEELDLAALGVHVQRRKKVIEEVTTEATVPVAVIAQVLGLLNEGMGHTVEVYDASESTLPVPGPLTILVKSLVEHEE